jgi:CubicO group peptidase (beta-lactamase class C family)
MIKTCTALILGLVFGLAQVGQGSAQTRSLAPPSDADIRKLLIERIDVQHQGVGIVVGVIDARGRRIIAHGALNQGDPRPLDGDTVFEIGSMTKVFTSLLLADMVEHGEVALDDPAAKYLPAGVTMPERNGRKITLIDLATHTSGLPRIPDNLAPKDPNNPYADYTTDQLYRFLSGYTLTRDIGAQYDYSNLGVGLLGQLLTRRAGQDYETLVRRRITGPLGMTSTAVALSPSMKARFAVGHDAALAPVETWDIPTLVGAGGLRSTANDLLTFLGAELGLVDSPLKAAMKAQLAPRRPMDGKMFQTALGWVVFTGGNGETPSHGGETGGYRSWMAFNQRLGVGVVVLSNANTSLNPTDIGVYAMTGIQPPSAPPPAPPSAHHAVAIDAATLERYVGRYAVTPSLSLTITRDGDRLFVQMAGRPAFEVFPDSPKDFFLKVVEAQLTFQVAPDGRVTGLVLHQNGRDLPAARVP